MRPRLQNPLLIAALLLWATASAAANLVPSQVLGNTQQLNGQDISVIGVISFLKAGITPDGKPYQSFKLCDTNACLQVYTRDKSTYTEGKQVTVEGHFWAVRHEGATPHFNELVLDTD